MLASLLAAATWLLIASSLGWPVSTTHSIVGAIVSFGIVGAIVSFGAVGVGAVAWDKVIKIMMSCVESPVLAGTLAMIIFKSLQALVIDTKDPLANAKKYLPFYAFFVDFIIALVTLFKGLKHIESLKYISKDASLSVMIAVLMVIIASAMAFAHGSNDVANAIDPLAAVYSIVEAGGDIASKSVVPSWVLLVGGGGIVFVLVTYGFKVMKTIGKGITELTPSPWLCC